MGLVGWTLDNNVDVYSPLLFLLADTLPNNLLNFRIHDFVVTGWLHSLRKMKYKQNTEDIPRKDAVFIKYNDEGKRKCVGTQILSGKHHKHTPCGLVDLGRAWQLQPARIQVSCNMFSTKIIKYIEISQPLLQRNVSFFERSVCPINYSLMHKLYLSSQTKRC